MLHFHGNQADFELIWYLSPQYKLCKLIAAQAFKNKCPAQIFTSYFFKIYFNIVSPIDSYISQEVVFLSSILTDHWFHMDHFNPYPANVENMVSS